MRLKIINFVGMFGRLIFSLLMMAMVATASAQTFRENGINYIIGSEDEKECLVTYGDSASYAGHIVIPREVEHEGVKYAITGIGAYAFSNCMELITVSFGDNILTIGNSAFRNCKQLSGCDLPEGTSLGSGVFYGCSSLTEMTLPASMEVLPDYTFYGCKALKEVGNTVQLTSIGAYAFSTCTSLKTIVTEGFLKTIGDGAFSFCSSLEMTCLSGDDMMIGNGAFSACTSLGEVWTRGVYEIGDEAFSACNALATIAFDETMKNIGSGAFHNCPSLRKVISLSPVPPYMSNITFDTETYDSARLEVATESVLLYRQTPPWVYFKTIEAYVPDITAIGSISKSESSLKVSRQGSLLRVSGPAGSVWITDITGRRLYEGEKGEEDALVTIDLSGVAVVTLNSQTLKIIL